MDFNSFMVVEKMPIRSCLQMEVKPDINYIQLQQHNITAFIKN